MAKLKVKSDKRLENEWRKGEVKFWKLCNEFLNWGKVIAKVKKVIIMPTDYGTFGSYHPNITKSGYVLTLSSRSDTSARHVADSHLYLTRLGFPPVSDRNYNILENILTTKEKILFNLLKNGKLTGFDAIGDVLWPNRDDKFSLYAITKLIEGLRKKMRSVGLDSSILKTSKGQGYFLT